MRIVSLSLLIMLCLVLSAPAFADIYNNGPTNGTQSAYLLSTYQVSDSFVSGIDSTISAFTFAEWVPAGATPATVDWEIGTTSFGSDVSNGGNGFLTAAILPANVAPVCSAGSSYGGGTCGAGVDDIVNATVFTNPLLVTAGTTYWLTLTNAVDSANTHDGWDINSGASLAYHSLHGVSPSESFTIYDGPSGTTPEPSSFILVSSGVLGLAGMFRRLRW